MTETFGDRLRRALDVRNMTASDLARAVWGEEITSKGSKAARNRQLISQYLRGQITPQRDTILRLALAMGVSAEALDPRKVAQPPDARPARSEGNLSILATPEPGCVRLQVNRVVNEELALNIFRMLSA